MEENSQTAMYNQAARVSSTKLQYRQRGNTHELHDYTIRSQEQ